MEKYSDTLYDWFYSRNNNHGKLMGFMGLRTHKVYEEEMICGFYAVNNKHCIPNGLNFCVVCNRRNV